MKALGEENSADGEADTVRNEDGATVQVRGHTHVRKYY